MTRRIFVFICLLLAVFLPAGLEAQQSLNIPRIGVLSPLTRIVGAANHEAFRRGLRELGYVEEKNILVEYRFGEGREERLSALAIELVKLKVNAIVTAGSPGVRAAKQATNTIPIVIAAIADAVNSGFVSSLAQPGGNITGLSFLNAELEGKRLELLKETLPRLSRVAILHHQKAADGSLPALDTAARSLGLQLQIYPVKGAEEFENAFSAIKKEGAEALQVLASPTLAAQRKPLVKLATKYRLPGIYQWSEFVEEGGLMSYAANLPEMYRRAAYFVDRILKDAKPADLPVEQPTKFELVINLRTAKQIGLTVPPNVLARADRVIR
jgi:putative ABC transport system substrate-binding protein